jgi:uncharacterized membrane protein YhaH (DUF805 family)
MDWYLDVLKNKYATFSGRARRKEYWMFLLINLVVSVALALIDSLIGSVSESGMGLLSSVYSIGVLIPSLALSVRRLHDIGRTGWWVLISIIPVIGAVVLLVFMLLDSEPGSNRYGANPKEGIL